MHTPTLAPTESLLDGRYLLKSCVGRGGTADVYRAEDLHLERTVAVKLIRDSGPHERPHRETTLLASLDHPGLVRLLDAQLAPGRARYLVMEYVEGPSLSTLLTHGPLNGQDAASIARDLAEALAVVHASGAIHRDVKPPNVLLLPPSRQDEVWHAKLTDFGIACRVDDPRLTSPGIAVGTAAYMAPEQVRGEELTPAVDVYALGLVLLEALTGVAAYPQDGELSSALARLTTPPEIPATLGEGWSTLIEGMTAAHPEARPSAAQVAAAAAALAAQEGPRPPGAGTPVPPPGAELESTPIVPARGTLAMTRVTGATLPLARHAAGPRRTPVSRKRLFAGACASAAIAAALVLPWSLGEAQTSPAPAAPAVSRTAPAAPVVPAVGTDSGPAPAEAPTTDTSAEEAATAAEPGNSAAAHAAHGGNPHGGQKGNGNGNGK